MTLMVMLMTKTEQSYRFFFTVEPRASFSLFRSATTVKIINLKVIQDTKYKEHCLADLVYIC